MADNQGPESTNQNVIIEESQTFTRNEPQQQNSTQVPQTHTQQVIQPQEPIQQNNHVNQEKTQPQSLSEQKETNEKLAQQLIEQSVVESIQVPVQEPVQPPLSQTLQHYEQNFPSLQSNAEEKVQPQSLPEQKETNGVNQVNEKPIEQPIEQSIVESIQVPVQNPVQPPVEDPVQTVATEPVQPPLSQTLQHYEQNFPSLQSNTEQKTQSVANQEPKSEEPLKNPQQPIVRSDFSIPEASNAPKTQTNSQVNRQSNEKVDVPVSEPVYTLQQRIDDSNSMKTKGNQYYKNGDYNLAIHHYYQGLRILDPKQLNKGSVNIIQESKNIAFSLILNIAQSQIKLGNFPQAVVCCSQVLMSEPRHFKALYKRATSNFELGKLEQALQDIKLAYEVDPNSRECIEAYRKIGEAYKEYNKQKKQEQKQLYKNMFNKQDKPEKSEKSQSQQVINTEITADKFSILKLIVFGSIGAAGGYFLSKQANIGNQTTQAISIAGAGASTSILSLPGTAAKIIGGIGLIAVGAFLYSKK